MTGVGTLPNWYWHTLGSQQQCLQWEETHNGQGDNRAVGWLL